MKNKFSMIMFIIAFPFTLSARNANACEQNLPTDLLH